MTCSNKLSQPFIITSFTFRSICETVQKMSSFKIAFGANNVKNGKDHTEISLVILFKEFPLVIILHSDLTLMICWEFLGKSKM